MKLFKPYMHMPRFIWSIFFVYPAVLLALSAPSAAKPLTCIPSKQFLCSKGGCNEAPTKVHAVINIVKRTYSRCDVKGCDEYGATMNVGGTYLNVSVSGRSTMAKIEIPSLQYFETISFGLAVYTSFGKCSYKLAPKQ